ncbi:MAG: hypothetical protein KDA34_14805 [Phycisphaerales bacterium]|nr:hypothetical protein [Phycisphaerales bacterium]
MCAFRQSLYLLLCSLIVAACNQAPSDSGQQAARGEDTAREVLSTFFTHLNEGRYSEAVELYGGSYDQLRDWNPSIELDDYTGLMQSACEGNGITCMTPIDIVPVDSEATGQLRFDVQFENDDGSLFVRGPCCGANSTDQPPQSTFTFSVVKDTNGDYLVMDLPPYVP